MDGILTFGGGGLGKLSKLGKEAEEINALNKATAGGEPPGEVTAKTTCENGQCFPPGTMVLMGDGSSKAIEDIKVGDRVKCENPTLSHKIEVKTVTALHRNWTQRFIHIRITECGVTHQEPYNSKHRKTGSKHEAEILATGHHPIWTVNRGWVWAVNLRPGDKLLEASGNEAIVESADSVPALSYCFNLTVQDAHSFFVTQGATSILVHNDDPRIHSAGTSDVDTKGVHITTQNGVELSARGGGAKVTWKPVFPGSTSPSQLKIATQQANSALENPKFKAKLLKTASDATDRLKTGTDAQRAKSGETRALEATLQKPCP
jgi:hypothetical protein